ncbi:hypothetical protein DITRI_Ditri20bG0069400 [Diplodiscus trichospermus]
METTPQCSKHIKNDSFANTEDETLLPGLPDDLAQHCLSFLSPSLISVCHPWRRLLASLLSFFPSLNALLSPSEIPTRRNLGDCAPQNSIQFFSFDPLSSTWRTFPSLPQDPPLHLLPRQSATI